MVGELIAGRYELEKLVGSGGMSNVFRAHDRLLERTVALKILHEQFTRDDDYVERFRREARAVAKLAHPNIVTVIDRGEQDGRQFIVFEYVDGPNLKDLTRNGPLEVRDAIGLTLQVARALSFAHDRGLVHRDVKPQNVLLNEDGQAKVTDFGIARSLDVQGVTQTGTVLGTSDYIAPEQARGQKVDPKTDIYSLGRGPLRAARRRGALLRGQLRRGRHAPRERAGAERAGCPARLPGSPRLRDPAGDGQGSRRPLCVDGRLRRRARGVPGRARRAGRRGRDDDRASRTATSPRGSAPTAANPDHAAADRPRRRAGRGRRLPAPSRRRGAEALPREARPRQGRSGCQGLGAYDPPPGTTPSTGTRLASQPTATWVLTWNDRELQQLSQGGGRARPAGSRARRALEVDGSEHRIRLRGADQGERTRRRAASSDVSGGFQRRRLEQDVLASTRKARTTATTWSGSSCPSRVAGPRSAR